MKYCVLQIPFVLSLSKDVRQAPGVRGTCFDKLSTNGGFVAETDLG